MAFYGDLGLMFLNQLPRDEALSLLTERAGAVDEQIASLERVPTHDGALGAGLFGVISSSSTSSRRERRLRTLNAARITTTR